MLYLGKGGRGWKPDQDGVRELRRAVGGRRLRLRQRVRLQSTSVSDLHDMNRDLTFEIITNPVQENFVRKIWILPLRKNMDVGVLWITLFAHFFPCNINNYMILNEIIYIFFC